jgi:hypothetical protein
MVGWGIFLIILGAGSLLLPMMNMQFRLMELVDPYQPFAGIIVAVIGAALVLLGMNRTSSRTVAAAQPPPASSPPASSPPASSPPASAPPAETSTGEAETEDPYRRP